MLNPSDVYVSGGSDKLLVCWTDKVTKYDASSFYNWEQDNLPLHDLDERTHLAWEKFGHPTSALTGMSFIVSGDATDSCDPLFFTTLSSCINALPEVINCPILIEVASFGNLGGLNLSNKAFGPNGALEIINRNSAFAYPRSVSSTQDEYNSLQYDTVYTPYALASAIVLAGALPVAAAVTLNTHCPFPAMDHVFASSFTTDSNGNRFSLASGTTNPARYPTDSRFTHPYVFTRRIDDRFSNRMTAALSSSLAPWDSSNNFVSALASFKFNAFDKTRTTEMNTYDVSTLNFITDSEEAWGDNIEGTGGVVRGAMSFSYFNSLEYIKVNECNGPVYIRNFNVDGQHSIDRGIEINNSKVNLERCSVSRCNKAGLHAENSEVNILRGIVAFRNYELLGSTRTGTPFAEKRLAYKTQDSYGAGIYANNSTINFKSTYDRDIEKSMQASSAVYGFYSAAMQVGGLPSACLPAPSLEALTCLSRNDIGIHAVNSKITGGRTELGGISTVRWNDGMQLFSELNTEAGIKLENSVLDYSGRLLLDGNYFGLDSANSKVSVDTLAARYNQSTGLKMNKSSLTYNKDLYQGYLHGNTTGFESYLQSQIACILNGQDISCDNSVITPLYTSSMPSLYQMVYASGCFGKEDASDKLLPSIHLKGNSEADLIHAHLVRDPVDATQTSQYGLLARVEDESTLTARGSSEYANVFIGPAARIDSVDVAGLYAANNSTIKLQGPTAIARLGVGVLAENNSNLEITPHQSTNGTLLVSSFDLSNAANHTMVEIHSTRSCLVVNRNSNIIMNNVGDYQQFWPTGAYASGINATYDYANANYLTYASGGFVQFYPNANIAHNDVVGSPAGVLLTGTNAYSFRDAPGDQPVKYNFLHTFGNDISGISTGGMCVRALEGSLVQADNVHFPATWDNCSGYMYDLEGNAPLPGPNCTRLFIWNIADNSTLKASYITVKGKHPRDSGYWGPSGTWGENVSGAPASTPDTGSLSILDYYGKSTLNPYGKSASGENFGAFRLYFSTDPASNFMVASGTNPLEGIARQLFAQGYSFSGNLIASSSDDFVASSQYTSVLQRDANGVIQTSGFYYPSSMMAGATTIKAVLDDSALNAFANAKHNTVGKSGLAKVVEGYYATIAPKGDSYNDYTYGKGLASINNFDLKKDN